MYGSCAKRRCNSVMKSAIAFALVSPRHRSASPRNRLPRAASPDLQGIWTTPLSQPLERPPDVGGSGVAEAQAASMEKASLDRREKLNEPSDPDRPAPPQAGMAQPAPPVTSRLHNFWLDPGDRVRRCRWAVPQLANHRSSDAACGVDGRSARSPPALTRRRWSRPVRSSGVPARSPTLPVIVRTDDAAGAEFFYNNTCRSCDARSRDDS